MAQDNTADQTVNAAPPAPGAKPGFKDIMREEWAQRKSNSKGVIAGTMRQQIAMANSPRVADFWSSTVDQIRRVRSMRREATRLETFEQACQRLKLDGKQLDEQFKQFRFAHWICYLIGAVVLLWSFWLFLTSGFIPATGALLFAVGALVNGYLYGFRAWQIQTRQLAPLTVALKRLDSYLVI
ncbi:MAG: hypothetical protein O9327_04995 [Polaromonas sp.]|jgi:hypothetical protein|nr:hypothetical protein [Polaromonas sp.]